MRGKPEYTVLVLDCMPEMCEVFCGLVRAESLTVFMSALRFFNHLVPHVPASVPFGKQVSFGLLAGAQSVCVSNLHANQYITVQLPT